jgi:hypothetical protein
LRPPSSDRPAVAETPPRRFARRRARICVPAQSAGRHDPRRPRGSRRLRQWLLEIGADSADVSDVVHAISEFVENAGRRGVARRRWEPVRRGDRPWAVEGLPRRQQGRGRGLATAALTHGPSTASSLPLSAMSHHRQRRPRSEPGHPPRAGWRQRAGRRPRPGAQAGWRLRAGRPARKPGAPGQERLRRGVDRGQEFWPCRT